MNRITNQNSRFALINLLNALNLCATIEDEARATKQWDDAVDLLTVQQALTNTAARVYDAMPEGVEVRCKDIVEVLPHSEDGWAWHNAQGVAAAMKPLVALGLVERVERISETPVMVPKYRSYLDETRRCIVTEPDGMQEIFPKIAFFVRKPFKDMIAPIE